MTVEVTNKTRGRPKKVLEKVPDVATGGDSVQAVTTLKRSTKSRSLSTTDIKAAATKKTARRKQVDTIEDAPPDDIVAQKASKSSRNVSKSKAPKSTILDEATAFSSLRKNVEARNASQKTKGEIQQPPQLNIAQSGPAEQVLEALQLKSAPASSSTASSGSATDPEADGSSHAIPEGKGESIIEARKPASESTTEILEALQADPEPATSKATNGNSRDVTSTQTVVADKMQHPTQTRTSQSSFLSSFLDDKSQETAPLASERDTITDRTAFNSSKLSAEDIVSGAGVSDLSSFRTSPPRQRKVPKTFKAHTLSAFEHGPQESLHPRHRTKVKQVEPETFAAGSFAAFKAAKPILAAVPSTGEASVDAAAPFFTQAKSSVLPAQGSVAHQTATPTHHLVQSRKPPIQTRSPTRPPQPVSVLRPEDPVPSRPQPVVPEAESQPTFPVRKPTEMTYTELKRNTDFKSLRRRWTGLIVGVPVLIVTSYVLWERLNVPEQLEGIRGERAGEGRTRGVVPRILDDGALNRGNKSE